MPILQALGSLFTNGGASGASGAPDWSKILGAGTGVAGAIGNFAASQKRNQVLNQQLDLQKQYTDMTPAQLAQGIQGVEQPLSTGLTQSVGNSVQGYLAERGLSQAPGIQAQTLTQALAPFQQQEQQIATQAYLQKLGLPIEASARFLPYPQSTDLSKLFQSLFAGKGGSGGAGGPAFGTATPGSPYGVGVAPMPTAAQLGINADSATPPSESDNNGAFNWMDQLQPDSGLTA